MLIKIGSAIFERDEISAILPKRDETLVFLRNGKCVAIDLILDEDDLAALLEKMDSHTQTDRKD